MERLPKEIFEPAGPTCLAGHDARQGVATGSEITVGNYAGRYRSAAVDPERVWKFISAHAQR